MPMTVTIDGPDHCVVGVPFTVTVTVSGGTPDGAVSIYSEDFTMNQGMDECTVTVGTQTQTGNGPLVITIPITIGDNGVGGFGNIATGTLSASVEENGVQIDSNNLSVAVYEPSIKLTGQQQLNIGTAYTSTYEIATNFTPTDTPTLSILGYPYFSASNITGSGTSWSFTGTGVAPGPVMLTVKATCSSGAIPSDELAVTVQNPPQGPPP